MSASANIHIIELDNQPQYQHLLGEAEKTCGMRSGRVWLQPGRSCGPHSTNDCEEIIIFLAGSGVALIGKEAKPHPVGQNKICYIPPQTIHDIKNTGKEPLVYVYCVAAAAENPPAKS